MSHSSAATLKRHPGRVILGLFLFCLGALAWGISMGLPEVGLGDFFVFLGQLCSGQAADPELRAIFMDLRLPRVLLPLVSGAGLALAGTGIQAVLENPLVSPSVLGVSAGASFGAALVIMYGGGLYLSLGRPLLMAAAFGFAVLASLFTFFMASFGRGTRETVILAGVAIGFIFSGCTVFLQYLAPYQSLRAIVFWTVGSLWDADWNALAVLTPIIAGCGALLFLRAPSLNALILGEEAAAGLGVNVAGLRLFALLICTLLSASIVSFTGAIGFVGLIAPHLTRNMLGMDHRWLIPGVMLTGGILLLLADCLARTLLWPLEIPVGVMTALLGGPFFLFQLLRQQSRQWP